MNKEFKYADVNPISALNVYLGRQADNGFISND